MKDKKSGEVLATKKSQDLLASDLGSAKNLLSGLNEILSELTNEVSQKHVEDATKKYLADEATGVFVNDFLKSQLTGQLSQTLNSMINKELNEMDVHDQIEQVLKKEFTQILNDYIATLSVPLIHTTELSGVEIGRTEGQFFHEKFEEILTLVSLDEPMMLIGPAGSGKNHAVMQVAKALGLTMYYTNNASNEFKLTGFIDAGGVYQETEFYKAFKHGGLFMLDEIDNSDPSSLIVINSALANGYMAFPHETIERHPDFRIISAANTWGKGSDLQYVGRNVLDGATLDRFDNIFFNYDRTLEAALYPNEEVLEFMWALRDAVEAIYLPHIVSTRGIGKVYKKMMNDISLETILRTNVVKNLRQDDVNLLIGNMEENIQEQNQLFVALKELEVGR